MCLLVRYLVSPRHEAKGFNAGYCTTYFLKSFLGSESEIESCSVMSDPMRPHGLQSMEFSRPEYWSILEYITGVFPSLGDLPNPGIKPRSPALQADSLPAEPQGKPKNTEVGSLSLLQQIFPTQESNRSLLHCRWILYQLSYQGSPPLSLL